LTCEGVTRSRSIVREAAEKAGRNPDDVPVYHELVVAPDMTDEEAEVVVGARIAAYCGRPGYIEHLFAMNGWDSAPLGPLREQIVAAMAASRASETKAMGRSALVGPGRSVPPHWKVTGAAMGSARHCAVRLHEYFDAGADRIIVHGVTPERIGSTVSAFVAEGQAA
jgi:alkanesulfonate monooxygenase SsuD/methylene tetrahydromethanopterin reductase-like flavin-dependent oxidoreductase (luciferase family)